ncbi:unnamed protein product [Phytophthora fragariaefolia]|uniref:Unnamed protein product n=1 Tax=Phytophthora fragariaefolia TaxID=1490495 RepID=A0A9W6XQT2_9STRA|nr:unnamed protein product [Phytophthora fragariaefolia]
MKHIHQLQDELTAARAKSSALSARLALPTAPPTSPTASSVASCGLQDELTRALADVASLWATLSTVNAELATSVAAWTQASDESASIGRERDALADELRATQSDLAQRHCTAEAAARLHAPLEEDVRRVNALLVAHAEERQRDITHIHASKASLSSASAARVVAEANAARARRDELQLVGRAQRFRAAMLESRRAAVRRRELLAARVCEQDRYTAEQDERLAQAQHEQAERASDWWRLLREARLGRELAGLVRDEFAQCLTTMVSAGGGTLNVSDLVRRLETQLELNLGLRCLSLLADPRVSSGLRFSHPRLRQARSQRRKGVLEAPEVRPVWAALPLVTPLRQPALPGCIGVVARPL